MWNDSETVLVARSLYAIVDAMAYRGFLKGRIVQMARMNSFVQSQFDLGKRHVESAAIPFDKDAASDPWEHLYDVQGKVDSFLQDKVVSLGLYTLDYLPILEIDASSVASKYEGDMLAKRHDKRMETCLIDAMSPDWGDESWYTTPATVYAKEHGFKGCIGVVVRTPYARSQRQTVGKNELYNLHMLATQFGYTSVVYLSFEPLTSYSHRVIDQKQVATHIEFFPVETSQYNIMRHVMVPYYRMLTEEGIRALEYRHMKNREFFPRISKTDPVIRWMQYPSHSMVLEVPHLGTGYDASRFCYVLAFKDTEDDGDEVEEE